MTAAPSPQNVFVTGANGRIGLALIKRLVAAGSRVTGLARTDEKAATVRALGAECVKGSLSDTSVLAGALKNAQIIYHLAGGIRGPGTVTPEVMNSRGTADLISAIRQAAPEQLQAVVFTSSVAVYGDRSSLWVEEDMRPTPNTRYGKSKFAAEQLLLEAGEKEKLPVRILRLGAVYGPNFPLLMIDRIQQGRAWLPGEGRNFMSTIHIDDAVEGLIRASHNGEDGEVYNLSSPDPTSLRDFYTVVHKQIGGRAVRFWSTWIPSYVQYFVARNNERVQSRLGTHPMFTPDNIRLFINSTRMKVTRIEKDLGMEWRFAGVPEGVTAALAASQTTAS